MRRPTGVLGEQRRALWHLSWFASVGVALPVLVIALTVLWWQPSFDANTVSGWVRGVTRGHADRRAQVVAALEHQTLLADMPCSVLVGLLTDHRAVVRTAIRTVSASVREGRCVGELARLLDRAQTPALRRTAIEVLINGGTTARDRRCALRTPSRAYAVHRYRVTG